MNQRVSDLSNYFTDCVERPQDWSPVDLDSVREADVPTSSFCQRNTVVQPEELVCFSLDTELLEIVLVRFLFDDNRDILERVPKLLRKGFDRVADYLLKISPSHVAVIYV